MIVLAANDFFVNQAVLPGETFPVEKHAVNFPDKARLEERTNVIFMGTNVRANTTKVTIVKTGKSTLFGQIKELWLITNQH